MVMAAAIIQLMAEIYCERQLCCLTVYLQSRFPIGATEPHAVVVAKLG